MTDTIKRIDELIKICSNIFVDEQDYKKVVYEIKNLVFDICGESSTCMQNYISIVGNKNISCVSACKYFVGILNGLKNHIRLGTKNRKYQVFISSTYQDLIQYRRAVSDEIAFRGHFSAGMEDFTACGDDLETYIKKVIDESDYYILIIGQRFGTSTEQDENISYTMMEYRYAKSKKMRIIPFIYNGTLTLVGNDMDTNKDKFDKFVEEVKKTTPQYFKDENELIRKLTKALEVEMKNHPQKGWIRL